MKNRNWKQEIKEWWNENKTAIKAGFAFGMLGAFAGFAAGVTVTDRLWLEHTTFEKISDASGNESDDDFMLDESNCDDPELLDLIRSEIENSTIVERLGLV